ncbi:hypothetical protein ACHAW6_006854 [Cyclotella cf. meneghiniana]
MSSHEVIQLADQEIQSPHKNNPLNYSSPMRTRFYRSRRRAECKSKSANRISISTVQRTRKSPGTDTINLEVASSKVRNPNITNRKARPKENGGEDSAMHEVIHLESDSSTSPPSTPKQQSKYLENRRIKHSVRSDEVEIIQIYSPPSAIADAIQLSLNAVSGAAASAAMTRKRPLPWAEKSCVDRIREVFPMLSRRKVESFLDMAMSFTSGEEPDDNSLVQIVMTVLADDPSGASITEKCFAAAVVGGRLDPSEGTEPSQGQGCQKVAQLECNCCFVEFNFEEMVSCRSGHLFCKICLQKHTEQRVFGLGNFGVKSSTTNGKAKSCEILCMHPDGCTSGFHDGQLRRALSEKVMKKYEELQYQAVLEEANMRDTSKCPKCHYIAVVEETATTFPCPQCYFKSCRECGEEAHPGIRCDQVETKAETSGRNKVEEAMTNAVIRKCPRPFCRKPFMKTDGCNKITCSCGAFICYICRNEIPRNVGYNHFCQTPHCNHLSCKKCGLYTDAESSDKITLKKAAKDAAKSVAEGSNVEVDVDSLLRYPPRKGNQYHTQHRHRNS